MAFSAILFRLADSSRAFLLAGEGRDGSVKFGKAAWSLSPPKRLTSPFYDGRAIVTVVRHTPFFTAPTAAPALSAFPQFLRRLRPPPVAEGGHVPETLVSRTVAKEAECRTAAKSRD